MKYYIDTSDNTIWVYEDNDNPADYHPNSAALELIVNPPSNDYVYENGAWILPTPTISQDFILMQQLINGVQEYMDNTAQQKGYDDIKSAALRSAYTGPYQAEGIAYAQWMDNCWAYCYQVKADVENSIRTIPTIAELITELPTLTLPV